MECWHEPADCEVSEKSAEWDVRVRTGRPLIALQVGGIGCCRET